MNFRYVLCVLFMCVVFSACGSAKEEISPLSPDAAVIFSTESGIYPEAFYLELSGTEEGSIYYTLDGSDPAVSDTALSYSGPIEIAPRTGDKNVIAAVDPILFSGSYCNYSSSTGEFTSTVTVPDEHAVDKCTVIRAVLCGADGTYSADTGAAYFIGTPQEHIRGLAQSCASSGTSLAVISISMDYNDLFDPAYGIYVKGNIFDAAFDAWKADGKKTDNETARTLDANYKQRGREWERICHMVFMEFSADGAQAVLSQNCGIRIQGNYSRSDLQKGFRLYARAEYGEDRFYYDVFGDSVNVQDFKSLILRAGGNCAFTSKFNDVFWQTAAADMNCCTQASRPCVVYLNGEYFGLYVLEEDYSDNYFEDHFGVDNKEVIVYKGDAETYAVGYKLDEGTLPDGVEDVSYFFADLLSFFESHDNLESEADYAEFEKLVDVESVRDYFLTEIWINNKWDWPGKNWSMWRTIHDDGSPYGDGRWRFIFYDMEFGGVSGGQDVLTNTVKEDNYKPDGLLDKNTGNPAVLCFSYLMTNEGFRRDFCSRLLALSGDTFAAERLHGILDAFEGSYAPLYEQFFERYPKSGSAENAVNGGYASIACLRDFIDGRGSYIPQMVAWIESKYP